MIKINFSLMDLIIPAKDINVLALNIFFALCKKSWFSAHLHSTQRCIRSEDPYQIHGIPAAFPPPCNSHHLTSSLLITLSIQTSHPYNTGGLKVK